MNSDCESISSLISKIKLWYTAHLPPSLYPCGLNPFFIYTVPQRSFSNTRSHCEQKGYSSFCSSTLYILIQQKNQCILLTDNSIQYFYATVYATKQEFDLLHKLLHKNMITCCGINRYKAFFVAQKING